MYHYFIFWIRFLQGCLIPKPAADCSVDRICQHGAALKDLSHPSDPDPIPYVTRGSLWTTVNYLLSLPHGQTDVYSCLFRTLRTFDSFTYSAMQTVYLCGLLWLASLPSPLSLHCTTTPLDSFNRRLLSPQHRTPRPLTATASIPDSYCGCQGATTIAAVPVAA